MFISDVNNDIIRIPVSYGKFNLDNVDFINVADQMERGNIMSKDLSSKDQTNHLAANKPDSNANVWYTSQ